MILFGIVSVFVICLLLGVPVVFSLVLASGIPILLDTSVSFTQMGTIILQQLSSFTLLAIPLFIYCGQLLSLSGVTEDLLYISRALMGKIRGDLAHVNIVSSIFFAGISGSSIADVASLGRVLIPAMIKSGYSKEFSATLTAASSTIGSIIPPSILLIVYGALAQTSIAALFLGGIIPGVLIGLVQMIFSYFYAVKHNIGQSSHNGEQLSKRKAIIKGFFPLSIFLIIIVGILSGVFTPTEAAGVTVIYVLLFSYIIYGKRDIKAYVKITKKAATDSATIYVLIAVASFLSWVLTYYEVMTPIVDMIKNSSLSANGFLIILTLLYVLLGTFMEPASAMLIFVPLLLPVMQTLNINPTVAGIVTVMAIRVGTITPPYGLCSLMAAKIAGTNVVKMMKLIVAFTIFYVVTVFIIIYFQDLVLILPKLFL